MTVNALVKKLQIKAAQKVLLVNAPENYAALLDPLPQDVELHFNGVGTFDHIQLFVKNSEELKRDLPWLQSHLRPDTVFWICYPKKTSGIASDLGMMKSWEETAQYGLDTVSAAAINETWTALRFKPKNQVKKSESCNTEIQNNPLGEYIDVQNRQIKLPEDLKMAMEAQPKTLQFFDNLSFTNKKEYVTWILTAKQEKTRTDRLEKTVAKLLAGKKNPSEK